MSRSVKPDYEKLRNPGNTRKLPPKVRVYRITNPVNHYEKVWVIKHPDGYVWAVMGDWRRAISVAHGLAKMIAAGVFEDENA